MDIKKEDVVFEIARRTIHNLDRLSELADGQDETKPEVYEVTHLLNSLLGLVVLPNEMWLKNQETVRLTELYAGGWPRPIFDPSGFTPKLLRDFIDAFRDSVAHGNINFVAEEYKDGFRIAQVEFWKNKGGKKSNPLAFKMTVSVEDLEILARSMSAQILHSKTRRLPHRMIEAKKGA